MKILAIDPGPENSGVVIYDSEKKRVLYSGHDDNEGIYNQLASHPSEHNGEDLEKVAIEDIVPRGHAVGKTTFDTLRWVERFRTACWIKQFPVEVVSRGDVMIVLCGTRTYVDDDSGQKKGIKDAQIKQVIIDTVDHTGGGKRPWIGTKKQPGPLFGVSGHCWSALAVALTVINA